MWSKWITKPLEALKEVVLIVLLMLILVTMIGGVLLIAIFNVPQLSLDSPGIYWYIGIFMIVVAPVLALARVIEWWVNLYRRFSDLF